MLILGFLNTGQDSDCSWTQDRYLAARGVREGNSSKPVPATPGNQRSLQKKGQQPTQCRVKEERDGSLCHTASSG